MRAGDRGVHQNPVATQLHRGRGIARGADTGVDQNRNGCRFHDEADVVRVANTEAGADWCGQRHYRDTTKLLEALGHDRIVIGIHHDLESVLHQELRRLERLRNVREQRFLVSQNLKLHQVVTVENFARQPTGAHGIVGAVTTRSIRQVRIPVRRQYVGQTRLLRILADIGSPDRHRDDLRPARFHRPAGFVQVTILAGTDQQPRPVRDAGNHQRITEIRRAHVICRCRH